MTESRARGVSVVHRRLEGDLSQEVELEYRVGDEGASEFDHPESKIIWRQD